MGTHRIKYCQFCGEQLIEDAIMCPNCKNWLNNNSNGSNNSTPTVTIITTNSVGQDDSTIRKIADCQRVSNIIWLIIAILQILSIIWIIAGIWNIFATVSSWELPKKILNRDSDVPDYYRGIAGLIIFAIINVFLGGFVGVILVGFDFYIRNLVLDNERLFRR